MAQLKLRIELNKGREGAPLDKLGDITRQMEKFLRALSDDLKLETKKGEWLGQNFRNGSVSYDACYQVDVPDSKIRHFNQCIEFVADYDPDAEGINGLVSDATLMEFGRLGERIDPDETIGLGIYSPDRKRLKWRRVEYRKASKIRQAMEFPIQSYGSVQGVFHAWLKEAQHPFFQLRELATENLVKCFYEDGLYSQIVEGLKRRVSVVHVSGHMKLDRTKRAIDEMRVDRLDKIEEMSEDEFRSFFGSSPKFTGDTTTQQFIDLVRQDG
jgi:hypothetical protein